MGLILLVLIGFLPGYYALNVHDAGLGSEVVHATTAIGSIIAHAPPAISATAEPELNTISAALQGKSSLAEVPPSQRWHVRESVFRLRKILNDTTIDPAIRKRLAPHFKQFDHAIE